MAGANSKTKNQAMLEAAKALAAAASSLASAAEALTSMCQEDSTANSDLVLANGRVNLVPPSAASVVDYEDSDDEFMIKAREQIRIEAVSMSRYGSEFVDLATGRNLSSVAKPGLSASVTGTQPSSVNGVETNETDEASARTPSVVATERSPSPAHAIHKFTAHDLWEPGAPGDSWGFETPANITTNESGETTPTPTKSWAQLLKRKLAPRIGGISPPGDFETPVPLNDDTALNGAANRSTTDTGTETPVRTPFQNLTKRWPQPTRLQKDMLDSLRTENDMLVCHGNLKSQTHAILAHCMEVLSEQPPLSHREGLISVLVIVPQQTTGRQYLNFANELLGDFGLPHKALLLPGGNSDVVTEAERMMSERIDILISSPRVFVNHVNSNPTLRAHLSNLHFVVFPEAQELLKKEEFLNYQFNMIKKRMPTRAKSPRQIIIASSGTSSNEQMQKFITRAFAPNPALIVSSKDGDDMLESLDWPDLLRD